jgi:hypothetical protein
MPRAMVKPKPKKPEQLKDILELFGNDRAYTIVKSYKDRWYVLFEGDTFPSIVTFEDEKPVILKTGPKH